MRFACESSSFTLWQVTLVIRMLALPRSIGILEGRHVERGTKVVAVRDKRCRIDWRQAALIAACDRVTASHQSETTEAAEHST